MNEKSQKSSHQIFYIPQIEEYFSRLTSKAVKLSNEERDALARLVYNSLKQVLCYLKPQVARIKNNELRDKVRSGDIAYHNILAKISDEKHLDNYDELIYLVSQIKSAVDELVSYNMRLIRKILISIVKNNIAGVDDEVINKAIIAMVRAIYNYNPYKGVLLSTYISWYVRKMAGAEFEKNMLSYVVDPPEFIKRPSLVFNKATYEKLMKTKDPSSVFGRYPSQYFISALTSKDVVSLYDKTAVDEDVENTIPAPKQEDPLEYGFVHNLVEVLPDEILKKIVIMYFGLDDGKEKTIAEIARSLGRSSDWVKRKLSDAIGIMKGTADVGAY